MVVSSITGSTTAKAAAILGVTLALGVAIGALGAGSLAQIRTQRLDELRGPGGFVAHIESVIEPRDEEQRATIRPFLEATDERNRKIIASANEALRGTLEQLQSDLDRAGYAPVLGRVRLRPMDAAGGEADPAVDRRVDHPPGEPRPDTAPADSDHVKEVGEHLLGLLGHATFVRIVTI